MKIYHLILLYVLVMNLIGYWSMWNDKKRAREHRWRISENMLMLIALLGGSIGSLAGMKKFRHKTKHVKFYIGIPLILVLQIAGVVAWFGRSYIVNML